ncbi:hypothetical protein AUC31_17650 [Planococcus rifietoensis]|uniref:Uncharacterized protein n=1 Tax=Planococcus rifietoensis TaxID=200991 RepID=A0A109QFL7_9BACL|nr:hypothetical protein AUC31_17650 [Planococcus rifietoensis]
MAYDPRTWLEFARHQEKQNQPIFDRHKTNRRSGAICHTAGLAYDPRTWLEFARHQEKQNQPIEAEKILVFMKTFPKHEEEL